MSSSYVDPVGFFRGRNFYCVPAKTLAARGLEEHDVRVFLIFAIIVSFMLFTVCLLLLMYFFSKNFWFTIHMDSWFWRIIYRICWACAIFRAIPNLQARTDGRTDGRTTDELIRVGLGPPRVRGFSRLTLSRRQLQKNRWFYKNMALVRLPPT